MFKAIIFIRPSFVLNKLYLIAANIRLILISQLIFVLDSNESDYKPFVYNSMKIKIDGFNDLIFFVLIFSVYFNLVLFLQTDFIKLFNKFNENKLHIIKSNSKTFQFVIIGFLITLVSILLYFSFFCYC